MMFTICFSFKVMCQQLEIKNEIVLYFTSVLSLLEKTMRIKTIILF